MILTVPRRNFSKFQSGLGNLGTLGYLGATQQLQQAQQYLNRAGYSGVECHEEKVFFPGIDPNTGLNYYTQEICTAPGFTGSFDVDAILNSTYATPGTGVNLEAERAYLMREGKDGPGNSGYAFADATNTVITNRVTPAGQIQTQSVKAPASADYLKAMDSASNQTAKTDAPTAKKLDTNTATASANVADLIPNFDIESIGSSVPVLIGIAALALLLLARK
jgi:hypothetical protein